MTLSSVVKCYLYFTEGGFQSGPYGPSETHAKFLRGYRRMTENCGGFFVSYRHKTFQYWFLVLGILHVVGGEFPDDVSGAPVPQRLSKRRREFHLATTCKISKTKKSIFIPRWKLKIKTFQMWIWIKDSLISCILCSTKVCVFPL